MCAMTDQLTRVAPVQLTPVGCYPRYYCYVAGLVCSARPPPSCHFLPLLSGLPPSLRSHSDFYFFSSLFSSHVSFSVLLLLLLRIIMLEIGLSKFKRQCVREGRPSRHRIIRLPIRHSKLGKASGDEWNVAWVLLASESLQL